MAFRQHRPQPLRQLSFHLPEASADAGPLPSSPQRKRTLEDSEEWVLFSPAAPSTTRNYSVSTEHTSRTAGLSHLSEFGSLDTAAPSYQIDDDITCQGTVTEEGEELDSLDDGLHAFHEPSEYGAPAGQLQESGMTVLPTHDGLGTFQPNTEIQEHIWQFERQNMRRRPIARRRSSVQRRLDALEEADEINQEQDRRQRIEKWRMEQSKALLEEIEKETRRRRRMSTVSGRSRGDVQQQEQPSASDSQTVASVSSGQSEQSDGSTENLSFWERLTRRVIRDLMGIDEDTLSVIFGEALPENASSVTPQPMDPAPTAPNALLLDAYPAYPGEPWENRLLERIARELGILVHQLSEHPGAFSTYLKVRETPEYVGMSSLEAKKGVSDSAVTAQKTPPSSTADNSPIEPVFASINYQQSALHSDASLWGIEEEPEQDPLNAFRARRSAAAAAATDESTRDREYWEQELDVKMVFNFLLKRFTSSQSAPHSQQRPSMERADSSDSVSARRAAIIRQHHPLVNRNTNYMPTSSSNTRENRRKDLLHRHHSHHFTAPMRSQVLRSSSSCASQSTKKSKRSSGSKHNYWDFGGSGGSGSVLAGEV